MNQDCPCGGFRRCSFHLVKRRKSPLVLSKEYSIAHLSTESDRADVHHFLRGHVQSSDLSSTDVLLLLLASIRNFLPERLTLLLSNSAAIFSRLVLSFVVLVLERSWKSQNQQDFATFARF
jgi:hypothetical protein